MADVTIVTTDATGSVYTNRSTNCLVYTSASVGYFFYVDSADVLSYVKTTDGGQTWGGATAVASSSVVMAFGVWFDQWTSGNTGSLIHVWWLNSTLHDVLYRNLDTSSDTLGTERTVFSTTSGFSATNSLVFITGARMRGGNLNCVYRYAASVGAGGSGGGHYRSTDDGVNWGSRAAIMENSSSNDTCLLFPGNEADDQDSWCLFQDASANQLTLKVYDDSADSVSESAAMATLNESSVDSNHFWGYTGAIRHSDGHLLAAYFFARDAVTSDLVVYDIADSSTLTQKTNVTTDIDDMYYPSLYVDNESDDVYLSYIGKRDGSETLDTSAGVYYVKSTDGMTTWSAGDTTYSAGVSDWRNTWSPLCGPRFAVAWRDISSFELLTNYDNSLDLSPATATSHPLPRRLPLRAMIGR